MKVNRRNKILKTWSSTPMLWTTIAVVTMVIVVMLDKQSTQAADIVVYKSPTCNCCTKWVRHVKQAGFTVEVRNQRNLDSIKAELGVPQSTQSCHTAKVGGYLVEGHVPADLIQRLLLEKPDIKGLAVPGMPMGSPGMEGPRKDDYNVLAIANDGSTDVYARR